MLTLKRKMDRGKAMRHVIKPKALPEDLFNMTNGHDLCRASAHKPNFFPTLSASMFSKQPTVKIV